MTDRQEIKYVCIKTFPSRISAELSKTLLDAEEIPCYISADNAGGMRPAPFQYTVGARIFVRETDAQRAHELFTNS